MKRKIFIAISVKDKDLVWSCADVEDKEYKKLVNWTGRNGRNAKQKILTRGVL